MNITHEQAKEERRKVNKYVHDHPGAYANEIAAALNIKTQIVASRLRQLRARGDVHVVGARVGASGTWHPGPDESKEVSELPPIAMAMGYHPITPKRGRHIAEAHSHGSASFAVGIQSGFACVCPDHG